MKRAVVVCFAFTLLAGACDRSDTEDPQTAPTATAAAPTPEPTPCVLEDASEKTRSNESDQPFSPVTDVRWDTSKGCPRIVFEFRDHVPGYTVEYADAPFSECGSGEEVDVDEWDATGYLSVRMEPSGGGDMETGKPTYDGPRDISVDGDVLKHLRRVCDFEAVYEWVIGVDEERPFEVRAFEDPSRLVVDITQG